MTQGRQKYAGKLTRLRLTRLATAQVNKSELLKLLDQAADMTGEASNG